MLHDLADTRRTLAESRDASERPNAPGRSWSASCPTICAPRWPGCEPLAEGLEDGVIDDVPRAMAQLRGTVSRMTVLVDDLFALSRVQQGARESKPDMLVSLAELIRDVASESAATAQAQNVALEIVCPTTIDWPYWVRPTISPGAGQPGRQRDPAHRARPAVRLEGSRAPDGHVALAVIDGCGGIPAEHLDRVFDPGWRGSPSRGEADGGAGLGLAITRGVVESHAGEISVRNVPGGCRFEVTPSATPSRDASSLGPWLRDEDHLAALHACDRTCRPCGRDRTR